MEIMLLPKQQTQFRKKKKIAAYKEETEKWKNWGINGKTEKLHYLLTSTSLYG